MIYGIIGKKEGMTQVFVEEGKAVPVTVILAGPCWVTQIKNNQNDGYSAVQLGFLEKTEKNIKKPQKEYLKKNNLKTVKVIREFSVDDSKDYQLGSEIKLDIFKEGDIVNVTGVSKGKGFQGVIKRHGFKGGKASHGSMHYRAPGSIGASSFPSRVFKGTRLPGRMGTDRVTVRKMKIVKIDLVNNLLLVKGSVPGVRNGILLIKKNK